MAAKKHNIIAVFEGLTPSQASIVAAVIDSVGTVTCEGSYLAVPDATKTDVDLIYGLAGVTGRLDPTDKLDPETVRAAKVWQKARDQYHANR